MREQQFIRFVQQICYLLKLSQPCSKTALQYFLQFKEYPNHYFDQEILIAACIYLSVKIFEEEVRIRDILNMIYVLTSLYKISQKQALEQTQSQTKKQEKKKSPNAPMILEQNEQSLTIEKCQKQKEKIVVQNQNNMKVAQTPENKQYRNSPMQQEGDESEEEQPYILLKNIQKLQNLKELIQPQYSLSDYNQYKGKIIEAEQTLLRILGFNFSLSEQNKNQLKRLLITIHHMRIPPTIAETILRVYNDIHYIDIKYCPEGVIYFSFLLVKVLAEEKEKSYSSHDLQLKEGKSEAFRKRSSQREAAEIIRIREFVERMSCSKKWQEVLCVSIKELENYAQKLTLFYSQIETNL